MEKEKNRIHSVGKRKSAVARLYMSEGKGQILINGRKLEDYFPTVKHQFTVLQPLKLLQVEGKYDFMINVKGGGLTGQAEAIRHAISKALVELFGHDSEQRHMLKEAGFLTRDSRVVERKKYGQPKARKQYQFSKR
jgi:small subunit ribosomal protein S9